MPETFDALGFRTSRGGAHGARTMMYHELGRLLDAVPDAGAPATAYRQAVVDDNGLGKPSGKSRRLSYEYLADLYALTPAVPIFRGLRFFWSRDSSARPLLAFLAAYARDAVLRDSAPFILPITPGTLVARDDLEKHMESRAPGRYSPATRRSIAQNINGSWTQSGHLAGRAKKVRTRVQPASGAVAFALYLGFLKGIKGSQLFVTEFTALLELSPQYAIELAEAAARRGWLRFNRIGDIMEIDFPELVTPQDRALIREQIQTTP